MATRACIQNCITSAESPWSQLSNGTTLRPILRCDKKICVLETCEVDPKNHHLHFLAKPPKTNSVKKKSQHETHLSTPQDVGYRLVPLWMLLLQHRPTGRVLCVASFSIFFPKKAGQKQTVIAKDRKITLFKPLYFMLPEWFRHFAINNMFLERPEK